MINSMLGQFLVMPGTLLLIAVGFFETPSSPAGSLPAIPNLTQAQIGNFKASLREQIGKAFEKARANPADGEAMGRLGMIFHAHEQLHQLATVCYQRAGLLAPQSFQWAYYLGVVQAESGKEAEAVTAFRKAVRLRPDSLPAQLKLAESLLASGRWEESGQIYEALLPRYLESPLVHYGLGQVQSARGNRRAAAESYGRACRLSPGFRAAHYALAMIFRDLGERAKSEEHLSLFQQSEEGRPQVKDSFLAQIHALQAREDVYLSEGQRLEREGHLEQAVANYERALEGDSSLLEAHANLVSLYGILGLPQKAENHYGTAIRINPNHWESHNNFGVLLRQQGRYQEAARVFRRALDINPFSAQAHSGLAEVLAKEGQLEEAIRHCQLALESDPHFRFAHFTLGRLLQRRGKNREAIQHFLKTLTVEDQSTPLFLYTLAKAYARGGNRQKAIAYAQWAQQGALSFGHGTLVAEIERLLRRLD